MRMTTFHADPANSLFVLLTLTALSVVQSGLELMPAGNVYRTQMGQNVQISCIAKGDYPAVKQARERVVANLQWKYRDKLIPRTTRGKEVEGKVVSFVEGPKTLALKITNITGDESGTYECSYFGLDSQFVSVQVKDTHSNKQACSHTEFRCQSEGYCIAMRYRCDGFDDCSDGSDEVDCTTKCKPPVYRCPSDSTYCGRQCDGLKECPNGEDERNCHMYDYTMYPVKPTFNTGLPPVRFPNGPFDRTASFTIMGIAIGFVSFIALIVIAVCRIRMKRRSMRSLHRHQHGRHRGSRPSWQQQTPIYTPPTVDAGYVPIQRCPGTQNVALNINLTLSELSELVIKPPPYSENTTSPYADGPPPPYSTVERNYFNPVIPRNLPTIAENARDRETHAQTVNNNNHSPADVRPTSNDVEPRQSTQPLLNNTNTTESAANAESPLLPTAQV